MVDDVQGWVGASSSNHGWFLIGNEIDIVTTKRFVSSEGSPKSMPGSRRESRVGIGMHGPCERISN